MHASYRSLVKTHRGEVPECGEYPPRRRAAAVSCLFHRPVVTGNRVFVGLIARFHTVIALNRGEVMAYRGNPISSSPYPALYKSDTVLPMMSRNAVLSNCRNISWMSGPYVIRPSVHMGCSNRFHFRSLPTLIVTYPRRYAVFPQRHNAQMSSLEPDLGG